MRSSGVRASRCTGPGSPGRRASGRACRRRAAARRRSAGRGPGSRSPRRGGRRRAGSRARAGGSARARRPRRRCARRSRRCATRSASCWTASGLRMRTASTTFSTRARAARRHLVGETHDGDDQRDVGLDGLDDLGERNALPPTSASRRLRDSASAGNASSASNAAVSRRPWPSFMATGSSVWRRRGRGGGAATSARLIRGAIECVSLGLVRVLFSSAPAIRSRTEWPDRRRGASDGWSSRRYRQRRRSGIERRVDPRERLLATEHARRSRRCPGDTGRAGERDPQRLVDVARLAPRALDDRAAAPARSRRRSNGSTAASASRTSASAARPSGPSQRSRAAGSSTGPSKMNPPSGQKSASVWIFSALIAAAARRGRRGR